MKNRPIFVGDAKDGPVLFNDEEYYLTSLYSDIDGTQLYITHKGIEKPIRIAIQLKNAKIYHFHPLRMVIPIKEEK